MLLLVLLLLKLPLLCSGGLLRERKSGKVAVAAVEKVAVAAVEKAVDTAAEKAIDTAAKGEIIWGVR